MKIKPIFYYIAGFVISVLIGFWIKEYIGFVVVGAIYAILTGLALAVFNVNPVEKSIYDKRKKDVSDKSE